MRIDDVARSVVFVDVTWYWGVIPIGPVSASTGRKIFKPVTGTSDAGVSDDDTIAD